MLKKSWGCKPFELDDQGKLYFFVFWETFKYLCSFLSAVPNENNMIFKQNLHIIILFKSLHPLQKLEDFLELLRTNKGLMNNYHKTEQQSWIIQETTQIIKIQLLNGVIFYEFSYYFVLWSIYCINICYVNYFLWSLLFC